MKNSIETGIAFASLGALCSFTGYLIGKRHGEKTGRLAGKEEGAKEREDLILQDFVAYIPLGEIPRVADELIEDEGVSENFPMLIIRPDKYDYLEGVAPDDPEDPQ